MRRTAFLLSLLVGTTLTTPLFAQTRGNAEVEIEGKKISVEYGRPSLQGRDMLGRLAVGGTWRMGADASTTLETSAKLKFGDKVLDPGKYQLTAKRASETEWHLVVNGSAGNLEIPLETGQPDSSVETFTINLEPKGGNKGRFSMAWGSMKTGADFSVE